MIIEKYRHTPKIGKAFFYCTFEEQNMSAPAILRYLLVQLISGNVGKAQKMLQGFEREMADGPSHSTDEISKHLKKASGYYDYTTIVIDGLDECAAETRKNLISSLVKLPIDSDGRIRILMSSRPEQDIAKNLLEFPEQQYRDSVRVINLAEESCYLHNDLEQYVNERFGSREWREKLDAALREEIETVLLVRETL